jgi:peptidoglycan/LPS O-acetylase OafA/YrhL
MERKPTFRSFLWRRLQRLYPTFLAVFGLYLGIQLIAPDFAWKLPQSPALLVWYLAANLLMLPGIIDMRPMITVAWSLSYELFFYTFIGFFVRTFSLPQWRPWRRIVVFATLAVILIVFTGTRMAMFVAGVLLWEMTTGIRAWRHPLPVLEIPVCILFLYTLLVIGTKGSAEKTAGMSIVTFPSLGLPLLFVSAFGLTLYSLYHEGILHSLFSWDYIRWLGNMSYSFYLIHGLALHALRLALSPIIKSGPLSGIAYICLAVLGIAFSAFISAVLFLNIEKPWSLTKQRHASSKEPRETVKAVEV